MGIGEMTPEEVFAYSLWLENGAGETHEALHAFMAEPKR